MNKENYEKKKHKTKLTGIKENNVQRYKINTTINFGSSPNENLSLKLNAMGIEDNKYKVAKLDFSN